MTKKLIGAVIAIVIGLALLPVVGDFAGGLTQPMITNTTTSGQVSAEILQNSGQFYGTTTGSMIDLLPILFGIILIAGAVAYVVISKRE